VLRQAPAPPGARSRLRAGKRPSSFPLGCSMLPEPIDALAGGSTYDALVALTARHHALPLLSTDTRAVATYRSLGAEHTLL
jgi:predicted nucleic acid-binding protein